MQGDRPSADFVARSDVGALVGTGCVPAVTYSMSEVD